MESELKPCPECNAVPIVYRDDWEQEWRIQCECPHRGDYNTRENAIAAWNRRPSDAILEAAQRVADACRAMRDSDLTHVERNSRKNEKIDAVNALTALLPAKGQKDA